MPTPPLPSAGAPPAFPAAPVGVLGVTNGRSGDGKRQQQSGPLHEQNQQRQPLVSKRNAAQPAPWWALPELFAMVVSHLDAGQLRPSAAVSSCWAQNVERLLSVHCDAGDALQRRTEAADQVLEDFVAELRALSAAVCQGQADIAALTLRVHLSRRAEQCRIAQTHLRGLMAAGEGCGGLCARMVLLATARRDACAAVLARTIRRQCDAESAAAWTCRDAAECGGALG
eukprot:TRINITY_DN47529_c0_g1_i1.p2 TRINITY_DN47529_c0_g1~~TRINITY_DN47529_c0_g1_i1.p2  ORF type:complete len:228 (+),score=75.14 TRINITY_DN47529_c0_g1_i1:84-767(+)